MWRKYTATVGSREWSLSGLALVHDRSEIGNKFSAPAQAACLWWPRQWSQTHLHKYTINIFSQHSDQWLKGLPICPVNQQYQDDCWRLKVDNCKEKDGDINPSCYKMCSTLYIDCVVGQWPKSSIPHPSQGSLCIFAPRLSCARVICWQCLRVETSQCQCSGRWGEGLAAILWRVDSGCGVSNRGQWAPDSRHC